MLFGMEIYLSEDKCLKGLVFKDNDGRYLLVIGFFGIFRINYKVLCKEEFFCLEECYL